MIPAALKGHLGQTPEPMRYLHGLTLFRDVLFNTHCWLTHIEPCSCAAHTPQGSPLPHTSQCAPALQQPVIARCTAVTDRKKIWRRKAKTDLLLLALSRDMGRRWIRFFDDLGASAKAIEGTCWSGINFSDWASLTWDYQCSEARF